MFIDHRSLEQVKDLNVDYYSKHCMLQVDLLPQDSGSPADCFCFEKQIDRMELIYLGLP